MTLATRVLEKNIKHCCTCSATAALLAFTLINNIIAIPHYEFGYDNIVYWFLFGSNNLTLGYWNLNRSITFWLLVP